MWKRDEAVRPASGGQPVPAAQPPAPAPVGITGSRPETHHQMEKDIVNIGKSVVIKGELNGSEDLTIEGHVEGTIQLRDHVLTIGPNGKIKAQAAAQAKPAAAAPPAAAQGQPAAAAAPAPGVQRVGV